MSNNIDEITSKIKYWIENDRGSKYQITDNESPYILKITTIERNALPPIMVFKPDGYFDKIGIYTGIDFDDEQRKSFNGLTNEMKEKIMNEIINGISMMGLVIKIHPNKYNLQKIHLQEMIYFDGISKDRIMNAITKVLCGFVFIISVLEKYNITRPTFDPSTLI